MNPEWAYLLGHKPFAEVGSDILLTVASGRSTLYIADADVITQVTTRRNDFPKPLADYKSLDLYGKNVVSTEGSTWRVHRKATAPSFSEKNNELVFIESLHHSQALLKLWTGPSGQGNLTVKNPAADTMRFALYIISRAGFGVRVLWPHEEVEKLAPSGEEAFASSLPPPGHKMSYRDALNALLENILWTQVFPQWFLGRFMSPSFVSHVTCKPIFSSLQTAESSCNSERLEDPDGASQCFHWELLCCHRASLCRNPSIHASSVALVYK